jgi:hypothetical protein
VLGVALPVGVSPARKRKGLVAQIILDCHAGPRMLS